MKKKTKIRIPILIGLIFCCYLTYLFRHPIIERLLNHAVQTHFQGQFVSEGSKWEGEKLVFYGLEVGDDFKAEKAEIQMEYTFWPPLVRAYLSFDGLEIQEGESGNGLSLAALIPQHLFEVKLDVEKGQWLRFGQAPLSFTFASGQEYGQMGTLAVYDEIVQELDPILFATFNLSGKGIAVDWQLEKASLERLFSKQWLGTATGLGKVIFTQAFTLTHFNFHGEIDNLFIPDLSGHIIAATRVGGELSFDQTPQKNLASWIEGMSGTLNIEAGSVLNESWGLSEAAATASFKKGGEQKIDLKGQFVHSQNVYPIQMVAQGAAHLQDHIWIQTEVTLDPQEGGANRCLVSLCKNGPSNFVVEADVQHFSTDGVQIGLDALALYFPNLKNGKVHRAEVEGKATAWIEDDAVVRLDLSHCHLLDCFVHFPRFKTKVFIQQGDLKGEWTPQGVTEGFGICRNSALWVNDTQWDEIAGEISLIDHTIHQGSLQGCLGKTKASLQFQGPLETVQGHLTCQGPLGEWISRLYPLNYQEGGPVAQIAATFVRHKEQFLMEGEASVGTEKASFEGEMNLQGKFVRGWLDVPFLSEKTLSPLLKALDIPIDFQGHGNVVVLTEDQAIEVQGIFSQLQIATQGYHLAIPQLGATDRPLVLKKTPDALKVEIPLKKGSLKTTSWTLDQIEGLFEWSYPKLSCPHLKALFEGLPVAGEFAWSFLEDQGWEATVTAHEMFGPFSKFGCTGMISVPKGGIQARLSSLNGQQELFWNLHAEISDAKMLLPADCSISEASATIDCDAFAEIVLLKNLHGNLHLPLKTYPFQVETFSFHKKNEEIAFDLHVDSLCSLNAISEAKWDRFEIAGTFFSTPFVLKKDREWLWRSEGSFQDLRCLAQEANLDIQKIPPFEGTIDLVVNKKDQWTFSATSPNLSYEQQELGPFRLNGSGLDPNWKLDLLQLGDCNISSLVIRDLETWQLPNWELKYGPMRAEGKATLTASGLTLSDVRMDTSESYHLQSRHPIYIDFNTKLITDISLDLFKQDQLLAYLQTPFFSYEPEGKLWESGPMKLAIGDVAEGTFKCRLAQTRASLQGVFQTGKMTFSGGAFYPKELVVLMESPTLNVKLSGKIGDSSLQALGRFDLRDFHGGVMVRSPQSSEQLGFTCGPGGIIEKIEGSWEGISCQLEGKEEYQGSLEIVDSSRASQAFPWLAPFNHIALKGTFSYHADQLGFRGDLIGKETEIFGWPVDTLSAKALLMKGSFAVDEMKITDKGSGSVEIKHILGNQVDDQWHLSIPLIKFKQIRPTHEKPFALRSGVFSNIRGKIGDLSSFQGEGLFHFTNRFRKEVSLFDAPVQLLKEVGLDLDAFTPVIGEVACFIQEGKIFLTDLKNTFSEGQRSEFFLTQEPSYIDLTGNIDIHLKIKQQALIKLGEVFNLAISGTLEKPQYMLRP